MYFPRRFVVTWAPCFHLPTSLLRMWCHRFCQNKVNQGNYLQFLFFFCLSVWCLSLYWSPHKDCLQDNGSCFVCSAFFFHSHTEQKYADCMRASVERFLFIYLFYMYTDEHVWVCCPRLLQQDGGQIPSQANFQLWRKTEGMVSELMKDCSWVCMSTEKLMTVNLSQEVSWHRTFIDAFHSVLKRVFLFFPNCRSLF